MTIAKGRVSIFTFPPVLPNRIYANFVAKTRLPTPCPLISEIEKARPGWTAGLSHLRAQVRSRPDERYNGRLGAGVSTCRNVTTNSLKHSRTA